MQCFRPWRGVFESWGSFFGIAVVAVVIDEGIELPSNDAVMRAITLEHYAIRRGVPAHELAIVVAGELLLEAAR